MDIEALIATFSKTYDLTGDPLCLSFFAIKIWPYWSFEHQYYGLKFYQIVEDRDIEGISLIEMGFSYEHAISKKLKPRLTMLINGIFFDFSFDICCCERGNIKLIKKDDSYS